MSIEEIVEAALKLDPQTRWQVVERIAASFQESEIPEEKAEALWLEEAAQRARELREGKAQEIPGNEVMARARALLLSDIVGTWKREKSVEAALTAQDTVDENLWK